MESVTTYCQADYLLSGKLPTVGANYLLSKLGAVTHGESNYLLSGRLPTVRQANGRCQRCTQKAHTLHPKVSAYMHPTSAIFNMF